MSNSKVLLFFSLLFFLISVASSASFKIAHKCSPQQTHDLLLFKQNLSFISLSIHDPGYDSKCQNWLGSNYYPIMMNWNNNTDCCSWDGITCNHFTGDVIGIDLSCGMLQGTIHPNTSLFNLPHLQRLNLAYNDFTDSQLPHNISRSSNGLTHLNISSCGLTGEISWEFLFLPKLVSLDLSGNSRLQMQPYVLQSLLRNFTYLRKLLIGDVDIGWILPTFINISSSLKSLDLSHTGLQGKLPDNMFNLPYLEKFDLSGNNDVTGPLPKVNTSNDIPLKWLHISSCSLVGSLSKSLVNLRHLTSLDLSYNMLNGTLPSFLFTLPFIENIKLGGNMLSGGLPLEFFNCGSLKSLSLRSNQFDGKINGGSTPPSFIQLINLTHLDLSSNNFTGVWDVDKLLSSLPNLQSLKLSYSGVSLISKNSSNYANPDFWSLALASCNLTLFPESLRTMKKLSYLDLSYNNIHGHIPDWAREIGGSSLYFLDLSYNSITSMPQYQWDGLNFLSLHSNQIQGMFPPSICNMRNLRFLDISDNSFSGVIPQCLGNISSSLEYLNVKSNQIQGPFPSLICNMRNLVWLDISDNSFSGVLPQCLGNITSSLEYLNVKSNLIEGPFPSLICNMKVLEYLDISGNSFSGFLPQCLGNISSSLLYLNVKSNKIQGPFPISICNLSTLTILDMSNNSFSCMIPQCFANMSSRLRMVDIGDNQFYGTIPNVYGDCGNLEALILNGNQFQGEVPSSLSNCHSLKVLDLGNNQLNGTFPGSLGDLPNLQVLILKSNKLQGPIETSSITETAFPVMRVLDLSHNRFEGHFPAKYFQHSDAMKEVGVERKTPNYLPMYLSGKYYSVTPVVKFLDQPFMLEYIIPGGSLTSLIVLDLSRNSLTGQIPYALQNLLKIEVLNLSSNRLTGEIPQSLADLTYLEVLDLSSNRLTGEIPHYLKDFTFLVFLNFSQNYFVGRIPQGTQINTLKGSSFGGNLGLCGFPLPKECDPPSSPQLEVAHGDGDESGFTWKVVMMGYGCGTLPGLVIAYVMLSTGRPKCLNELFVAAERMIQTRKTKRRRYIFIGK